MPWTTKDVSRHTKKARTATERRAFVHVANSVLKRTGNEGRAVRAGNAAVNKSVAKTKRQHRRSSRK